MKEIKVRVPYVSCWDGGTTITTSAILNLSSGEITEIEIANTQNDLQVCEREYIILGDEEIDVVSNDQADGYWIQLHSDHVGPCTKNYLAHREAILGLSIADIARIVEYTTELSYYLNDDSEILDEMDRILKPFEDVMNKLKTEKTCRHDGGDRPIYKSDLPQYDYVCPECDENFFECELS